MAKVNADILLYARQKIDLGIEKAEVTGDIVLNWGVSKSTASRYYMRAFNLVNFGVAEYNLDREKRTVRVDLPDGGSDFRSFVIRFKHGSSSEQKEALLAAAIEKWRRFGS